MKKIHFNVGMFSISSDVLVGLLITLSILFLLFFFPKRAAALTPPPGFLIQTVTGGLNKPVTMAWAPDGRIFIGEKDGAIRVIKNGVLLSTPVIQLQNINTSGDRGLLGLALDPNFAQNGFMYLAYTHENSPNDPNGRKVGRIVRVTVQGDTAPLQSMQILVGKVAGDATHPSCDYVPVTADCIPSDSLSHSVGGLRFGPDGKLYAALGDGAGFDAMDPRAYNAQNLDSLAGKMLRINTDGTGVADNPFFTGDPNANKSKIWFYGLRNSYKFNFKPVTGVMFFGDVGWGTWEEINVGKKGANYGWPCREGFDRQYAYNCDPSNYTNPLYVFDHSAGTAAVTGGAFPTTTTYPAPYNTSYFFGDATGNVVKRMQVDANNNLISVENFFDNAGGPVEFTIGPDGLLYYLAIYSGELRKMVYVPNGNNPPVAKISSNTDVGPAPLAVNFSSTGSSDPDNDPLTFSWNFGDAQSSQNSSTAVNPSHTYANNGTYTASLTVKDNRGGSNTVTKTIRVGDFGTDGANPSHVKTVTSPVPAFIGRDVTITSTISNSGTASPFIVDLEIYDKNNVQVAQKVFSKETIPQNSTKDYVLTWFPNDIGTYRVAVGLFKDGWTGLYSWQNSAATFTVEDRSPTSTPFNPTHVNTAVSNPSPTIGSAGNDTTTITTSVQNTGQTSGQALIDIEIYKDGAKVAQQFYDNQTFAGGETKDFAFIWKPTAAGTYKVSVGILKPGWSGAYAWLADIKTITVNPAGGGTGGSTIVIYGDGLSTAWQNWSWDTQVTFGQFISLTMNSPWAGFFLHTTPGAPVDTTGKSALIFSINGGATGGQKLQVALRDEAGNPLTTKTLDSYLPGGVVPANTWVQVSIPLSDLSGTNRKISGLTFQGSDGAIQSPFMLDTMQIK